MAASACPPPGRSVQMPAPKSAPASTVYAVIPTRMNPIGTSASTVTSGGLTGFALAVELERDAAEPAEQPEHGARQAEVDQAQGAVADRDEMGPGNCLADPHDVVDDPWLPSDLSGDPAGDQRHHGQRP